MPSSATKPIVLLLAVAGVLALLVGLVGSGGRTTTRTPAPAPVEPPPLARRSVAARTPVAALPEEDVRPTAPAPSAPAESAQLRGKRGRLTGLVLRPEGEPADRAQVVLGQQHARCDHEGRFELELTADTSRADLFAFEPGHEPVLRPSFGAGLGARGDVVRLVLGPETLTLSGTVREVSGQPVKGWTVELDELEPLATFGLRERVRTDGDGRFTLTDVPAGSHVVRTFQDRPERLFRSPPAVAGEVGITIVVNE